MHIVLAPAAFAARRPHAVIAKFKSVFSKNLYSRRVARIGLFVQSTLDVHKGILTLPQRSLSVITLERW
jgi:hypothetical protein